MESKLKRKINILIHNNARNLLFWTFTITTHNDTIQMIFNIESV